MPRRAAGSETGTCPTGQRQGCRWRAEGQEDPSARPGLRPGSAGSQRHRGGVSLGTFFGRAKKVPRPPVREPASNTARSAQKTSSRARREIESASHLLASQQEALVQIKEQIHDEKKAKAEALDQTNSQLACIVNIQELKRRSDSISYSASSMARSE